MPTNTTSACQTEAPNRSSHSNSRTSGYFLPFYSPIEKHMGSLSGRLPASCPNSGRAHHRAILSQEAWFGKWVRCIRRDPRRTPGYVKLITLRPDVTVQNLQIKKPMLYEPRHTG